MEITFVPSAVGPVGNGPPPQHLTTFIVDGLVALDAGSLGFYGTPSLQAAVRNVFLSHIHLDHVGGLPAFLDTAFGASPDCPTVHAGPETLAGLRRDLFNDRLWPDFVALSQPAAMFVRLATLAAGRPVEVGHLRVTPVPVHHTVPTFAFLVEGPGASVVYSADTGPTDELWRRARALPDLKAVFLEASFPDELGWLAEVSAHLTPRLFAAEVAKLGRPDVPVLAIHLKPRHAGTIADQLGAPLGLPQVGVGVPGTTYRFG